MMAMVVVVAAAAAAAVSDGIGGGRESGVSVSA